MIRKYLPLVWLLTLGLLLAGCGTSPPNNYYLLSAKEFPAPNGATPALGVGPIDIAEYLNRRNVVSHSGDNALKVADTDLWGEPLADGIQRVLLLNLAGLLNTQNVRTFPWHSKRAPDFGVTVNLLQLDANDQEATLTAEWQVYRTTSDVTVERRISKLVSPLPAGVVGTQRIAAAYSALLLQLSELIAGAIEQGRAVQSDGSEA